MGAYYKNLLINSKLIKKKKLYGFDGGWHISNSNIQRNLKIDLSNEDHCGTCTCSKYYDISGKKL